MQEYLHNLVGEKVDVNKFDPRTIIYALNKRASIDLLSKAKTIVFRNPHHQRMELPHIQDLSSGQRFVLVISDVYTSELPFYKQFLRRHGYDGDAFSNPCEPLYTSTNRFNPSELVFDYTKP